MTTKKYTTKVNGCKLISCIYYIPKDYFKTGFKVWLQNKATPITQKIFSFQKIKCEYKGNNALCSVL